ncbi:MAG: GtrA family protein [Sphingomonadales bacterium]|nr:MAG: GtrA family protein [Sphingomonadales bacterium]
MAHLWRFYQAGILNTAFGFGMYSGLVALRVNLYAAQIIAHLMGVAFNYLTYSRHVFTGAGPAKARFVAAYSVNYVVNLLFLALFDLFIHSPYRTGFLAMVCASLTNYFALKHIVFTRARETA